MATDVHELVVVEEWVTESYDQVRLSFIDEKEFISRKPMALRVRPHHHFSDAQG